MSNQKNNILLVLVTSLFFIQNHASTLVYSMRIRRAFNIRGLNGNETVSTTALTLVPIYTQRDRTIVTNFENRSFDESRKITGGVLNTRYTSAQRWWVEITTALAQEWFQNKGALQNSASKFELDDIVLAAGYNVLVNQDLQFVYYGIAGLPTSWTPTLDEIQDTFVGTNFFSLGAGSELSYSLINSDKRSLIFIFQNRLLHFFTRSWQPILKKGEKVQPGNAIDLLFSFMYRQKGNVFEVGYNPTFFNNEAVILANQKIYDDPFVRHGWYVRYSHSFRNVFGEQKPLIVGTGFSLSRAQKNSSNTYSVWGTFGGVF